MMKIINTFLDRIDNHPILLGLIVLFWPLPIYVIFQTGWAAVVLFGWYILLFLLIAKEQGGWSTVVIILLVTLSMIIASNLN